jgi:hypothetical protein
VRPARAQRWVICSLANSSAPHGGVKASLAATPESGREAFGPPFTRPRFLDSLAVLALATVKIREDCMPAFSKMRVLTFSAAALGFAVSAGAQADVLFDSLNSPNSGIIGDNSGQISQFDASFSTGASSLRVSDISLSLNQAGFFSSEDTFTVSLVGGFSLADVSFDPGLGLNVGPGLNGPVLGSVTLPVSDLSTDLTVEHFGQLAGLTLKANSFYWIDVMASGQSNDDGALLGWGVTADDSGTGVADEYNSSYITDFGFFPNAPTPQPDAGGPIFQMEIIGAAAPEPSTWALMLLGFAGLGFVGWRGRRKTPAQAG